MSTTVGCFHKYQLSSPVCVCVCVRARVCVCVCKYVHTHKDTHTHGMGIQDTVCGKQPKPYTQYTDIIMDRHQTLTAARPDRRA